MQLVLAPVCARQAEELAALARGIWEEHFTPIIGAAQVAYMLEHLQSAGAIREQCKNGYLYYFLKLDGMPVGYTAIRQEEDSLFLSKLYLQKQYRGRGLASEAFAALCAFARERGLSKIWLTVNRHNEHTIAVYQHFGFQTVRKQAADIGGGFVMDDYIMEKTFDGVACV